MATAVNKVEPASSRLWRFMWVPSTDDELGVMSQVGQPGDRCAAPGLTPRRSAEPTAVLDDEQGRGAQSHNTEDDADEERSAEAGRHPVGCRAQHENHPQQWERKPVFWRFSPFRSHTRKPRKTAVQQPSRQHPKAGYSRLYPGSSTGRDQAIQPFVASDPGTGKHSCRPRDTPPHRSRRRADPSSRRPCPRPRRAAPGGPRLPPPQVSRSRWRYGSLAVRPLLPADVKPEVR